MSMRLHMATSTLRTQCVVSRHIPEYKGYLLVYNVKFSVANKIMMVPYFCWMYMNILLTKCSIYFHIPHTIYLYAYVNRLIKIINK